MIPFRWIVIVAVIWVLVIVADELVYQSWKQLNPGSMYTGVLDQTAGLVDPNIPPATWQ